MTDRPDADVLIVGAGPVGLVAAIGLAQAGIKVIVAEKRTEPEPLTVRCNHVSSRSMEIFRQLGFADKVRAAGFSDDFPHDAAFRTRATGAEFARIKIPGRAGRKKGEVGPDTWWPTPEPPHRLNQIFLEPVMMDVAQSTANLDLRFDLELAALQQSADHVKAEFGSSTGQSQELTARYLVGCDGGGSLVRKMIGGRLVGDAVVQRVQSTYLNAPGLSDLMTAPPAWAIINLNPERSGTLYTIAEDDRFLVHNYLRPGEEDFNVVDRDASIRAILGVDNTFEYEILANEDWIGRRLVADELRKDRVFLAGDAAHIWVPYAGYGMNAGIADAFDLAWLLAARLKGWGGSKMLDAYAAERHPITQQVSHFAMSHAEKMIKNRGSVPSQIEEPSQVGAKAREEFGQLCHDTNVDQYCCAGLNFGYYYDQSPIICHDGSQAPDYSMARYTPSTVPGCRCPHVYLEGGSSLYDHLGKGYSLIRVNNPNAGQNLLEAANQLGVPMSAIDVSAHAAFDCKLLVVRPDQHIAWRGHEDPDDPALIVQHLAGRTD